ncbi:hypothetical protein [Sphingomonas sp. LH128]|jgi:hypothetical protein|uniref:hypothetical protein n=1 Tax=Sphingomonas sp. LH128 TaxID=473781 RepID=UPI002E15DEE4
MRNHSGAPISSQMQQKLPDPPTFNNLPDLRGFGKPSLRALSLHLQPGIALQHDVPLGKPPILLPE